MWTAQRIEVAAAVARTVQNWSSPIVADAPLRRRIEAYENALWTFNLARLHALLPEGKGSAQRHGGIALRMSGEGLVASLVSRLPRDPPRGLLWVELEPLQGDIYRFEVVAEAAVDGLGPDEVETGLAALLSWTSSPHTVTALWESLPTLRSALDFVRVEARSGPGSATTTSLTVGHDLLARRYPRLARYLRRLGPLIDAETVLREDDLPLARFALSTRPTRVALTVDPEEGWLAPLLESCCGPVISRPRHDSPTVDLTGRARLEMLGLVTIIDPWSFSVRPDTSPRPIAAWTLHPRRRPAITYRGALLGLIAPWAIDLFIPGNLESMTEEFTRVLLSPGPEGVQVEVALEPGVLRVRARGRALQKGLMSFALSRVRKRLELPAGTLEEYYELLGAIGRSLAADLEAIRSSEAVP